MNIMITRQSGVKAGVKADNMVTRWTKFFAAISAAVIFSSQLAQAATLESIQFASLPGDQTEIRMDFDSPPPEAAGYTIEQPARIVLDLPGVSSALTEKHHSLGSGNARKVSVIGVGDRTRAIVNLTSLVGYTTRVEGNSLLVTVGVTDSDNISSSAAAPVVAQQSAPKPNVTITGESQILDVDFRRGEDGGGQVMFRMSDPRVPVDVSNQGGKIRVEVRNTQLPSELRRRLDVRDFATPVSVIEAIQEGPHVILTIAAAGEYDYLAYQADQTMTLNVQPLSKEKIAEREEAFRFKGEKLSLNFQDIEVRSVLQLSLIHI